MNIKSSSVIGIIGSGAMGTGIAQVAASAGHEVFLFDQNPAALEVASRKLEKYIFRKAEKGQISDAEAKAIYGRIYVRSNISGFEDCDLIIEAVIEDLDVKKDVFTNIEIHSKPGTVLASNTSSLPITSIASACSDPASVIGIHFFNPAPLMKLVEIIPAIQTAPAVVEGVQNLVESWAKTTVIAQDTPGFIVNRIARPFYSEALRILDEGLATIDEIDYVMTATLGFRMGPFALMDFIGHDINFNVTKSMYNAYYSEPRYKPSFTQQRLVHAGYLGKKTGRGFYEYPRPEVLPIPEITPGRKEMIGDRILFMLINEAADAYHWKIASAEAIDTAMTLGVNYPKGLLTWANEIGLERVIKGLNALYEYYQEERYRCSPGLHKALDAGRFPV